MSRAYLSDTIIDGSGKPITGAPVTLLRAADYLTPPVSDPGNANGLNYVAVTTSGPGGAFSFDGIPPDDYHVMVQYAGLTIFKYNVPANPVETSVTKSAAGRVLVPRLLQRILAGESCVIHFVGDSITVGYNSTGTVGANFVQRMGVLIGQQLAPKASVQRYDPNAYGSLNDNAINGWNGPTVIGTTAEAGSSSQVIQIVNNGVSGDTVQRVLRRFGNLTGWTPVIDCHIIYLGINDSLTTDGTKFVDPDSFYSGIRALLDIIRNYYPQSDLVVCTQHHNDQPEAGNGGSIVANTYKLENYAMATRRAAAELGVALVDLRQKWADHFNPNDPNFAANDGYRDSIDTSGGNHTHPTDTGHQAIAEEIFKIFGTPGLTAERSQRIQTMGPQKHFKDLEVMRLPYNNPAILLAGGHWSTYTPDKLADLYASGLGNIKHSKTAGDTVTFTDRMQDFAIMLRRGTNCGKISVTIDGSSTTEYDTYRGYPTDISDTDADGAVYPMDKLWVANGLGDIEHTIVIQVLGTKQPASADTYFNFDGIEYTRWGYTARKVESPLENSRLQYGSFTCNITTDRFGTIALSFPKTFRSGTNPSVVASANQIDHYCTVDGISDTGCNIRVVHRDGTNESTTVTGQWLAIG
jgi:lysophospholipase L1-like esterase